MEEFPLNAVQRWMQSVIVHSQGVPAGLVAEDTHQHLDVPNLEQLIPCSPSQSSVERLAVYANAYYARLIECLQSEFPVFSQTVGEEAFAEFAADYVQRYPSRSYSLGDLGTNFPRYLAETKPIADGQGPYPDWAEFLVELANLERTFSEVFDGPGLENKPALGVVDLQATDLQKWPQARIKFAPCFRLLSLQFPLNGFYSSVKEGKKADFPPPSDSWFAVTRRDFIVRRYGLNRPQFMLLSSLLEGRTVEEAIGAAAESYAAEPDALARDLHAWFRAWAAAPFFQSVEFDD